MPAPPFWNDTNFTSPARGATTGVPIGAAMSWPWCVWPSRAVPKRESGPPKLYGPWTGKIFDAVVVVPVSVAGTGVAAGAGAGATTFETQALWYELDDELLSDVSAIDLLGALHAAEHSQIAVLPLIAMCDRWDIGGLSTNMHPQTGVPTIFIYDGHPGGVGITRVGHGLFETLVADAHRLVSECPCESGCPSCVQSPKCGNLNEPLSKGGSAALMRRMLDG